MIFQIQLAAAFIVGALFISMQTLIAERVSPKWRGIILTLPSTMAIGFFFVGLTKSSFDAAVVATIFPSMLGADYVFVMLFALLIPFGLASSIIGSFLGFAGVSSLILFFPPQNFIISILYALPVLLITYLVVSKLPQVTTLKPYPMNAKHIFGRGLIGGSMAFTITLLAKILGNIWGGIFSAFPAGFSSSLIIYSHLQGKNVIPAVAKSLFLPGIIGFILYALMATLTFPSFGIWWGTLLCYIPAILFNLLYTFAINRNQKNPHFLLNK